MQADETFDQIWHDEGCSIIGKYGRYHYDELVPGAPGQSTPEFDEAPRPLSSSSARLRSR